MKKTILFLSLFFSLIFLFSCSKDSLKSPAASFMVFNNPTLNITSPTIQGANSLNVTDVWYYVDEQFQGCYPIDGIVPIVASVSANIKIFGGIRNNGIGGTRQPYYFFKPVSFTQAIEAGKTYTYNPVFEYISGAKFPVIDDFEGNGTGTNGIFFQNAGNPGDSACVLVTNPSLVYGGTGKTMFLGMSDAKPTANIVTTTAKQMPLSGARIYMELNYKCNQEITVGVIGGSEKRPTIVLNATDNWKKIYIDLTTVINTAPTYSYYNFYISATKNADVANPAIYIDNVKVVTE
jgi:hypothetical protein